MCTSMESDQECGDGGVGRRDRTHTLHYTLHTGHGDGEGHDATALWSNGHDSDSHRAWALDRPAAQGWHLAGRAE